MSRICITPARGGSRRVPRKNIRLFHGKPIIAYSIETATQCGLFDRVYVSTDDDEITQVAMAYGAHIINRPPHLSVDEIGTQEVMRDAIASLHRPDITEACCIYATCPMLTVDDLRRGYYALKKRVARFAFSVGTDPLRDAGMFYWGTTNSFLNSVPLIGEQSVMVPMPENRVCDINTEDDWMRAELMYEAMREEMV